VNLYRVLPGPPATIPFSTLEQRRHASAVLDPPSTPWVRAIMVATPTGATVDDEGSSRGLTRGADRLLLGLYRESASVVLVGAETIRRERVPTPRDTPLAVVSRTGDFSGHRLLAREGSRVILVTSPEGAARADAEGHLPPHDTAIVTAPDAFTAADILGALAAEASTDTVLVEGGEALWRTLQPVTNELCITTTGAPVDDRAGVPQWWPGTEKWTLHSLMTDDSSLLYYRYFTGLGGAPSAERGSADLS